MKNLNYQVGRFGENLAQQYLTKKGYKIIAANFHTRFGEIDLIAVKNQNLVFVEVKLKIGNDFGTPEEMIGIYKLAQIQKMAECFIQNNPQLAASNPQYRIDAICIVLDKNKNITRINHWENLGNEMV